MMMNKYQNVRVVFEDSNFVFDDVGSYESLVSEVARAFGLDRMEIVNGKIKVYYFDLVDWIRVSSDEEFALSFFYKDANVPFTLKLDNGSACCEDENDGDVDSYVRERKERKRGRKRNDDNGADINGDSNVSGERKERKERKRGRKRNDDNGTDINGDSNVSGERKERKERIRGRKRNDDNDNPELNEKRRIEEEQRNHAAYLDGTYWPENITHLFIDGNNILYMTKTLRDNTLKKKLYRAQEIIVAATEYFASRITGLKDVFVIFDNISSTYDKTLENGTNLFIRSARPNFSTTDDMLVNWSEQNKDISPNSLHVSSDRALSGRLNIASAKVMKPKAFFSLTLKLTNQENESVDSWFSKVSENLV